MASQQNASNTSTASVNATVDTLVHSQGRLESWLDSMYLNGFHLPIQVFRAIPIRSEDGHEGCSAETPEPAAPGPEAAAPLQRTPESSLSSESGGVGLPSWTAEVPHGWMRGAMNALLAGHPASSSSGSTDTSTTDDSTFSWGVRSPRAPRSIPVVSPAHSETSSGYQADESSWSESDILSSFTESDRAPAQYTPDASPSGSDGEVQYTPDASSSDLDSEAQDIVNSVDGITRHHVEQMDEVRANADSNKSASSPSEPEPRPDPLPAAMDVETANEILAQLEREFEHELQDLYDDSRMTDSRGEYKAKMAHIKAVKAERRAQLNCEFKRLYRVLYDQARISHSLGEYKAEMARIKAFERAHRGAYSPAPSIR